MNKFKKYTLSIVISFLILFTFANVISYLCINSFVTTEKRYTINIEGTNINYIKKGSGSPILLIHGLNSSSEEFNYIIDDLAKNNTVIAIDLPIYTRDSKVKDYSVENLAEICNKFMASLNYDNYNVLGHGFGSNIALEMNKTQQNIKKTVLVSLKKNNIVNKQNFITCFLNKSYFIAFLNYSRQFLNLQNIDMNIFEKNYKLMSKINLESSKKVYNDNYGYNGEKNTSNLNGSVLIIDGDNYDDSMVQYGYELFKKHSNVSFHTIQNCGYNPQIEAKSIFLDAVNDFLK